MKLLWHLAQDSNDMKTIMQPPGISEKRISAHLIDQEDTVVSLQEIEHVPSFYKQEDLEDVVPTLKVTEWI